MIPGEEEQEPFISPILRKPYHQTTRLKPLVAYEADSSEEGGWEKY